MQRKKDKKITVSKRPDLRKKLSSGNKEKLTKVGKVKGMAKKSPAEMKKAPMKKALIGKQANLPKALRDKILASPGKMLKPAAMKMMKKSPTKMARPDPMPKPRPKPRPRPVKKAAPKMMKKKK